MATVGSDVAARETTNLIASDKVEGTPVRRSNGDKIGTIERLMVDKVSGRVAYAVLSFGGFLGIGDDYRALPWNVLQYNEDLDAYELNLTDEQLKGGPVTDRSFYDRGLANRQWEQQLHDYYRAAPYW